MIKTITYLVMNLTHVNVKEVRTFIHYDLAKGQGHFF